MEESLSSTRGSPEFRYGVTSLPKSSGGRSSGWSGGRSRALNADADSKVIPLTSWLLKGFFDNISDNIIQPARIDGLSEIEIFYEIALPIVTLGIAATAVFSFVLIWQELLFVLSILQTDTKLTMPVSLLKQTTVYSIGWPTPLTLSVLVMLPAMVIFFLTQNYLIRGMTGGTVD